MRRRIDSDEIQIFHHHQISLSPFKHEMAMEDEPAELSIQEENPENREKKTQQNVVKLYISLHIIISSLNESSCVYESEQRETTRKEKFTLVPCLLSVLLDDDDFLASCFFLRDYLARMKPFFHFSFNERRRRPTDENEKRVLFLETDDFPLEI